VVDRHRKSTNCVTAALAKLIWRVTDNHVELHIAPKQLGHPSLDVIGVYERIGVGLKCFTTVVIALIGTAVPTLAINPRVLGTLEPDVAVVDGE